MSLNSLSNDTFRHEVVVRARQVPRALESAVESSPATLAAGKGASAVDDNSANKIISALVKYIPTEMLATFVAAVSIAPTFNWNVKWLYVIWIIATPFVFLLIHYSKLANAGEPWPSPSSAAFKRVVYLAAVATVAFIIWGLSVPTNGASMGFGPVLAAFLAGIASPLLSILEPIVFRIIGE